jgi:murein L,D-transpeptidase YcbB/YkuD
VWLAVLVSLSPAGDTRAQEATSAPLANRVQQLSAGRELRVAGEVIAASRLLGEFYRQREFQPAWLDTHRQAQLLALVEDSSTHGLDPSDYHADALRKIRAEASSDAEEVAARDFLFSDALVRLAYHLHFGKTNPRDLYPNWSFSRTLGRIEPVQALEALAAAERLDEVLEGYAPQLPLYRHLRDALSQHRAIEAGGGWGTVPAGGTLRAGMRDTRVLALRARLTASGDSTSQPTAEPEQFDEALEAALKNFQMRHGLEADGAVGRRTLQALNVDVAARIEQIRVNLERLRWVAQDVGGDYLLVDIAGFAARLHLDGALAWSSRVVVGRPYRETPAFRATMRSIVLNPAWTVPPTVLREDVLPEIMKDRGYLQRHNMHLIDKAGRRVDAVAIDWGQYRSRPFPYRIVEEPGPANPLGGLKFEFPNRYGVYLHDSPAKALFERTERAFSSGCIRLETPHSLAALLLDDAGQWGMDALRAAIESGATRTLPVKRRVPVMALYLTADASDEGRVAFRADLYGADAKVSTALAAPFRFRPVDRPRRGGSSR